MIYVAGIDLVTAAREDLLAAGLAVFDRDGFEGATVAAIRTRARASNGSFFHFFGSKKELAGTLFLEILQRYHAAVLAALDPSCGAREGIDAADPRASGLGREQPARGALSVRDFAQRMDRGVRDAQRAQNSRLAEGVERWRAPLVARGELLPMTSTLFFSQIIGPRRFSAAPCCPAAIAPTQGCRPTF